MRARLHAINNLKKYLHKSEADRFVPKHEKAAAPPEGEEGISSEGMEALKGLHDEDDSDLHVHQKRVK